MNLKKGKRLQNQTDQETRLSEVLSQTDEGVIINVHIQPRASRTEYAGLHGNAVKFRISAPPVDGLANHSLCEYIAKAFRLSKGSVVICSGHEARRKRVLVKGITTEQVKESLLK